jgi:hypothetical protein
MHQLFSGTLWKVSNCTLGDSILEVGIDPTKGEFLPALLAWLFGGVVSESTIVAMVVFDFYAVLGSKSFKR